MIEINKKAKVDDPWDTPPLLTIAAWHDARDVGKLIQLFHKDDGNWRPYDFMAACRNYSDTQIEAWSKKPDQYQFRAHHHHRSIVYQLYTRVTLTPTRLVVRSITAASRDRLMLGIENLKFMHDSYRAVGAMGWSIVELTPEKELIYDAI